MTRGIICPFICAPKSNGQPQEKATELLLMKNKRCVNRRLLAASSLSNAAVVTLAAFILLPTHFARAQGKENKPVVIPSYHNDISPALRDVISHSRHLLSGSR